MFTSQICLSWHYKAWQRSTAGYLRTFARNKLPNNEMIGLVVNAKHPKTIKVRCDRYLYSMRYKKVFRRNKDVWSHDEEGECRLGDIVRVQPIGYRIGPWKKYTLTRILYRESREEGDELIKNAAHNLFNKTEDDGRTKQEAAMIN
eukprot:Platyproteum_vivax@DN1466_c0_g1_i1.p1